MGQTPLEEVLQAGINTLYAKELHVESVLLICVLSETVLCAEFRVYRLYTLNPTP